LIIGEINPFNSLIRAGSIDEIVDTTALNLRDEGEAFPLSAVPGPTGQGALMFAIDGPGGLTPSAQAPMTFKVGVISGADFSGLGPQPHDSMFSTSFLVESPDDVLLQPIAGTEYVGLTAGTLFTKDEILFALYDRSGNLVAEKTSVVVEDTAQVFQGRAATMRQFFIQPFISWVHHEMGVAKFEGQRMSCE
jgi:hypothetical protein